jgi:uncharacterized membrane protein YidH (DUF202 family)
MAVKVPQNAAKTANIASAISSGGDLASMAINVITNITDKKQRELFQRNFASLNADQQNKLNLLVSDANSEIERLRILTQALSVSNIQRINNIAEMYAAQERKKRNEKLFIAGGLLVVGVVVIILILKRK